MQRRTLNDYRRAVEALPRRLRALGLAPRPTRLPIARSISLDGALTRDDVIRRLGAPLSSLKGAAR